MSNKNGLKDFLHEYREFGFERKIKSARETYLNEYKEKFIELFIYLIIAEPEFPKSFDELEALADNDNKETVNIVKEAFVGDLAEALCSIKGDVPKPFRDDEYAAILINFGKTLYFKDSKQDWYQKKDVKLPKKFDVTEKEYCENPLILSGKTLMSKYKSWIYENEFE